MYYENIHILLKKKKTSESVFYKVHFLKFAEL